MLLASWDDGAKTDLRMAELMQKYNIPTIFYWPSKLGNHKNTGKAKSFLSTEECKELSKNFEIGSHSMTHQFMNKLSIAKIANEIHESRKFWQDTTGQPIDSFAYPKNSLNSLTKALVKGAGYTNARTNNVGSLTPGDDLFSKKCTLQIALNRLEYNNKSWVLYADELMEKINADSIFHIFGCSWEVDVYKEWDRLEDLIKCLVAKFTTLAY